MGFAPIFSAFLCSMGCGLVPRIITQSLLWQSPLYLLFRWDKTSQRPPSHSWSLEHVVSDKECTGDGSTLLWMKNLLD